jgi:hypothetical protein
VYRVHAQTSYVIQPKVGCICFPSYTVKAQETPIKAISISYDLPVKSSLDICFNKLTTNLRLPILINCDCKTVTETPENILLHANLANCALSTRHLSLEFSTNMTNLKARSLKSLEKYSCQQHRTHFTQLYHFKLVSHTRRDNMAVGSEVKKGLTY